MFFVFIIFIILLFAFCYISAPYDSQINIKRNGTVYKTLKYGQSTFINPFTDTYEYVKSSAALFDSSDNTTTRSTSTISNKTYKLAIPVYSLDKKSEVIYVKGSYSLTKSLSVTAVHDVISKLVRSYYSGVNFSTSPLEITKNELNIFDLLRNSLAPAGIKIHTFSLSLTDSENFAKVDCTHYDEETSLVSKKRNKYSPNFNYYETNLGAITHLSSEVSDSPIKESSSITSIIHNTLENMDSNIDPIDNKY